MVIRLRVKGLTEDVEKALHKHGISEYVHVTSNKPDYRWQVCVVDTSDGYIDSVVRWFCETTDKEIIEGFGYPRGTLLHYTFIEEELGL